MNEQFEDLMYRSGLTASGCWDEMDAYDQAAIMSFAKLIIDQCSDHALDFVNNNQSLPDKVMRSNLPRVTDYIKDRMGVL